MLTIRPKGRSGMFDCPWPADYHQTCHFGYQSAQKLLPPDRASLLKPSSLSAHSDSRDNSCHAIVRKLTLEAMRTALRLAHR